MTYTPSPILDPQFIPQKAAALLLQSASGPVAAVASGQLLLMNVCRVINVAGEPVTLTIWRVPNGGVMGNVNLQVPGVSVPIPNGTSPWFDLGGILGSIVLQAGDSLWGEASQANALTIVGDGQVVTI